MKTNHRTTPESSVGLTKRLLKEYRSVRHAVDVAGDGTENHLILTANTYTEACSGLGFNGVDISNDYLENHKRYIDHERMILEILETTLEKVKIYPYRGELLYLILKFTYFSPSKFANRGMILRELYKNGYDIGMESYENYLNKAIGLMDRILWGHIVEDTIKELKRIGLFKE